MLTTKKAKAMADWLMSIFDKVQALAFKLPFVKIDKTAYLRHTLKEVCSTAEIEQAIATSPIEVLGEAKTHKIVRRCIWKHALFTCTLSALAVAPNNSTAQWALLPLDLIQFQLTVYIVAQKLMHLYGHSTKRGGFLGAGEAAVVIATVSAVMIGTHRISQTMKSAVGATARRTVLHIGTRAGNRLIAVKFIQQLLKWLGIEVTKSTLVISLEYIISALCMSISAIVTFWLIYPMCNRLVEYLKEKNQRK